MTDKTQARPVLRGYYRESDGKYYHEDSDVEFVSSAIVSAREYDRIVAERDAVIERLRVVSAAK